MMSRSIQVVLEKLHGETNANDNLEVVPVAGYNFRIMEATEFAKSKFFRSYVTSYQQSFALLGEFQHCSKCRHQWGLNLEEVKENGFTPKVECPECGSTKVKMVNTERKLRWGLRIASWASRGRAWVAFAEKGGKVGAFQLTALLHPRVVARWLVSRGHADLGWGLKNRESVEAHKVASPMHYMGSSGVSDRQLARVGLEILTRLSMEQVEDTHWDAFPVFFTTAQNKIMANWGYAHGCEIIGESHDNGGAYLFVCKYPRLMRGLFQRLTPEGFQNNRGVIKDASKADSDLNKKLLPVQVKESDLKHRMRNFYHAVRVFLL